MYCQPRKHPPWPSNHVPPRRQSRPLPQTASTLGAATGAACPAQPWCARDPSVTATLECPTMAIAPELRAQILRLYQAEQWRVGTIARQLQVHRDTVRSVLEHACVMRPQQPGRPSFPQSRAQLLPARSVDCPPTKRPHVGVARLPARKS